MFFFLSKVLGFLSQPLVLIVIFLGLSLIVQKKLIRKRFRWLSFVSLIFFSNSFIANEVMRLWEVEPIPLSEVKEYEVAVVLSGVIQGDMNLGDRPFFSRGADRIYHPVKLYKLGKVDKIFASGGTSRLIDIGQREARNMAIALEDMGVKEEDIFLETQSRNTRENAYFTIEWLKNKYQPQDVLLVTSAFHMRRASACFANLDFELDTFSCDLYSSNRRWTFDRLVIPSLSALKIWHILFKEWTGMAAYKLAGYI